MLFWSNYKIQNFLLILHALFNRSCSENNETLKFVSVVFRHGDRTPIAPIELYPKDPYINYNFGVKEHSILTKSGEWRTYKLGKFLRNTYSTFLGNNYIPGTVEARSTNVNRTKESLNFVLKALYPNVQIPTIFNPLLNDSLLLPQACNQFLIDYLKTQDKSEVRKEVLMLQDSIKNLSELTGKEIRTAQDMHFIYTTLENESFMNLSLPTWTQGIFPDGDLMNGSVLQYKLLNYDESLKKQGAGTLIRKFIEDMISVRNGSMDKNRKLMLYSAHDITIAAVLHALGVFFHHVPKFSSAVIVELHLIKKDYYIKVLYYLGVPEETRELIIPNCEMLCPLDQFVDLMQKVIPSKVDFMCREIETQSGDEVYIKTLPNIIKLLKILFA